MNNSKEKYEVVYYDCNADEECQMTVYADNESMVYHEFYNVKDEADFSLMTYQRIEV